MTVKLIKYIFKRIVHQLQFMRMKMSLWMEILRENQNVWTDVNIEQFIFD